LLVGMDIIELLANSFAKSDGKNSVARRDEVTCQETQLLEGMDVIELLANSFAKSDRKN